MIFIWRWLWNIKITEIQLFDYATEVFDNDDGDSHVEYSYSANIAINNDFLVQVSGNRKSCDFNIPDSSTACWETEESQDYAFNFVDKEELKSALEANGFENNIGWLADNANMVLNPENAKYRHENPCLN